MESIMCAIKDYQKKEDRLNSHSQPLDYYSRYFEQKGRDHAKRDKEQSKIFAVCVIAVIAIIALAVLAPASAQPPKAKAVKTKTARADTDTMISPDMADYIQRYHVVVDEYGVE